MSKEEMPKKFNLEERTACLGEEIIDFVKIIPKNEITRPIINQLVRAGTAVGANYCEADCAESKKDFEHKMGICNKEAKETKHWMRMLGRAVPEQIDTARRLWKEAHELNLIFTTIIKNSKNKPSKNNEETSSLDI